MKALAIAASMVLVAVAPAPAIAQDLNIINDPAQPRVVGASAKMRDDPAVQGGTAMRVTVKAKGANPWDVSVQTTVDKPVKAGDELLFAFWARLEKSADGESVTLPSGGVQMSSEPYTSLFSAPVTIGPEWKLHEVTGKADRDRAAGTLQATIHLATGQQTVDFGPIFVVNLGQ